MQKRTVFLILTIATSAALGVDAACVEITIPPAVIDSNTTFIPQVAVKNNGSEVLRDVPVSFNVVRASDPADTIYHDTARSGQIGVGQTGLVDFGSGCSPDPDAFTMTGITELPGDTNPHNDTCSRSLFVLHRDVAVEIVSPRDTEEPGLVAVWVRLTNMGNVPVVVPRFDLTITANYLPDYRGDIPIGVGEEHDVTLIPWAFAGGTETCTAWITYPEDMYPLNDTDVVIVNAAGISGSVEARPRAVMNLTLSPSPLSGNVLRVEYSLGKAGPAKVTLFGVSGQVVAVHDFIGIQRGEFPLDLRHVSGGVYLARLDDGRSAVTRKLVVQR